jgi:FdrA protein
LARTTVVRKNRYFDSVFLMQVARRMAAQPGISDASALLATEANRKVLIGMGYGQNGGDAEFAAAGPNDLVIALEGEAAAVETIAADAEAWLVRSAEPASGSGGAAPEPRSLAEAVLARPDSGVAVISVPGEYAAREARAALQAGLNVFLFSSNVAVEDERALKGEAKVRGLIVMGPDCGTAFLGGAGLGFANAVRRGPIGIVGSTGTGLQEFSSLVHQAGSGISNGIGTGSRDLSDAIGGLSTLAGLDALEADPATKVIAVLCKPPGQATTARLLERLRQCAKPIILCLLGAEDGTLIESSGKVQTAATIDDAVGLALAAAGVKEPAALRGEAASQRDLALARIGDMRPEQRHIRGLFAGGTLCYQSQAIFQKAGLVVHSNAPLPGMPSLPDPLTSRDSSFVDMGAELFVEGRPHPMIDASLRKLRLVQEGQDPSVAVLLLDFILGAIASRNPVGDLLGAIGTAQAAARSRGGHVCVVASVCGTDEDAQDLQAQNHLLADAGVLVFSSNARAAAFCRDVLLRLADRKEVG